MDVSVATWLIGGLCVLANLAVTTILATLIRRWFDHKDKEAQKRADEREAEQKRLAALEKENEQRHAQAMMDERCNIQVQAIRTEIQPVVEQLNIISGATVSGLRDDLLNSYWRCHDWQKFRPGWDTENMEDLYKAYKKMGGNSFIDHLMEEFYKIPLQ